MNVLSILRTARIVSWSYRILSTLVGLVTIRLINDRLGVAGYGDVAFVLAMLMGVVAVDLGLLQAIPRFVARNAGPEHAEKRPVFWATTALASAMLLLLQLVLVGLLVLALQVGTQLHHVPAWEFAALGACFAVGNALTVGSAIYAGWQRYGAAATAKIGRSVAYLMVICWIWFQDSMSLRNVLWANAVTLLLPNALVTLGLLVRSRRDLAWSWGGFPSRHRSELQGIAGYSLRGWLFTLSTTLLTAGSVTAAGFLLQPQDVAKLQISLVLYTGVATFITGAMVPLTTISARFNDGSAESSARVLTATRALLNESLLLCAILLVFFATFGAAVVGALLGNQAAQPDLASHTAAIANCLLVPGLVALPFFTFRFAIIDADENGAYCLRVLIATIILLGAGCALAAATARPVALTTGIGAALVYRAALGYRMSRRRLSGFDWLAVTKQFAAMIAACGLIAVLMVQVQPSWQLADLRDAHLQAALYLVATGLLYNQRKRLAALFKSRHSPP